MVMRVGSPKGEWGRGARLPHFFVECLVLVILLDILLDISV